MGTLVDSLCAYFNCDPHRLSAILQNPAWAYRAEEMLRGRTLRTIHQKRRDEQTFEFGGITCGRGSSHVMAYEGFNGTTVNQHFYTRHHRRLKYPRLPCAIWLNANGHGHHAYYPLELLVLV